MHGFDIFEELLTGWGGPTLRELSVGEELVVGWELEFATDRGNAAYDVCTVNWASIPGICGHEGLANPIQKSTSSVAGNGDCFVEVPEEPFDRNSFVVALGGAMESDTEQGAHGLEEAGEGTSSIHHNQTTDSKLQQDLLEENMGQRVSTDVRDSDAADKLGEVAHAGQEVLVALSVNAVAWAPKVAVEHKHGTCDGPAEL